MLSICISISMRKISLLCVLVLFLSVSQSSALSFGPQCLLLDESCPSSDLYCCSGSHCSSGLCVSTFSEKKVKRASASSVFVQIDSLPSLHVSVTTSKDSSFFGNFTEFNSWSSGIEFVSWSGTGAQDKNTQNGTIVLSYLAKENNVDASFAVAAKGAFATLKLHKSDLFDLFVTKQFGLSVYSRQVRCDLSFGGKIDQQSSQCFFVTVSEISRTNDCIWSRDDAQCAACTWTLNNAGEFKCKKPN